MSSNNYSTSHCHAATSLRFLLRAGKPLSKGSNLLSLSLVYDKDVELMRVGGHLRKAEMWEEDTIHPIILSPDHHVTKLLIQDDDNNLLHAGPDHVFAELRRMYWIICGCQDSKKHLYNCTQMAQQACHSADSWPASCMVYTSINHPTGLRE